MLADEGRKEPAMKIQRKGSAAWSGGPKDGKGAISTESGALKDYPYGFTSRFENQRGTNPEELIGAAHAGCFAMAVASALSQAGLAATKMDTDAKVTLEQVAGAWTITAVRLTLRASVPGADPKAFEAIAVGAKANCPVSKLLKAEITLDAQLVERGSVQTP
jgi:osmotically inducible protein OsmC